VLSVGSDVKHSTCKQNRISVETYPKWKETRQVWYLELERRKFFENGCNHLQAFYRFVENPKQQQTIETIEQLLSV
jgi:hypothetical protein